MLSYGHQAPGCLQPMLFICPTTALRSNGNIGHRDAYNPCRPFIPITALGLGQNISTRMPMTPAVFHYICTTSIRPGCLMSVTPPFTQPNLGSPSSTAGSFYRGHPALVATEACSSQGSWHRELPALCFNRNICPRASSAPLSHHQGTRITHI